MNENHDALIASLSAMADRNTKRLVKRQNAGKDSVIDREAELQSLRDMQNAPIDRPVFDAEFSGLAANERSNRDNPDETYSGIVPLLPKLD